LFSKDWKFHRGEAIGAQDPAFRDDDWRMLDLPHDWSIELPFREDSPAGTGGGFLDGGVGWYRKTFTAPAVWSGRRVRIIFDGAYMNSRVWLNGTPLGDHPYGYTTFAYDLTPHLRTGAKNTIAVRLDNNQPTSRWYSGSGLYRNVWLTVLNPIHADFCGLFVSTPQVDTSHAAVQVNVKIRNLLDQGNPVSVRAVILDPDGRRVAAQTAASREIPARAGGKVELDLAVTKPRLWSVDSPVLYTLRAEIYSGRKRMDVYKTAFGIRTFAFDADRGFFLNGMGMKLNGVCLHHDLGALGAAFHRRAAERQFQLMKAMGCNAIRTTHNPADPMVLDLCDRMGFLVIDEAFDAWKEDNKNPNDYNLYFDDWAQADLQAMIRRDRNHPSVVMYSIGNEIHDVLTEEGVERARRLIAWVREEDSTRPVTHGSNFNEMGTAAADLLDVVGYNYHPYLYDRQHSEFPHWRMYASETSSALRSRGVYKSPTGENILTGDDRQCSSYDNSIPEWGSSAEKSHRDVITRRFLAGEFIWTGVDYLGEPTPYEWPARSSYFGIVDTCGFPKDVYGFYQSRWTSRPMIHLLPHWNWSEGEPVAVWVYTNCESAELFLNGISLGIRRFVEGGPFHLEWIVPFQPGALRAEASLGGRVAAVAEVRTAGAPQAIRLTADRNIIAADGEDLAFLTAEITDGQGVMVPAAGDKVEFSIEGPGILAGTDNGNPICHESFQSAERSAFHGKCLAIVQSTGTPGRITVRASSAGLRPASVVMSAGKKSGIAE
jgi:beta-galactosidase